MTVPESSAETTEPTAARPAALLDPAQEMCGMASLISLEQEDAIYRLIRENIGGDRHYGGRRAYKSRAHLVSYGAAHVPLVETEETRVDEENVLRHSVVRLDPQTMSGASATGKDLPSVLLATEAFLRSTSRDTKFDQKSHEQAVQSMGGTLKSVNKTLNESKESRGSDGCSNPDRTTGFRVRPDARLVYASKDPDTSIIVVDPSGRSHRLPKVTAGTAQLQPGLNIIITRAAPKGVDRLRDHQVQDALSKLNLNLADPAGASKIAQHLTEIQGDGSVVMATVINVDHWEDRRARIRKVLDYLRPSTYGYLAATTLAMRQYKRRELYEQNSNRANAARKVAYGVDLGSVALALTVLTIGRNSMAPLLTELDHGVVGDLLNSVFHHSHPKPKSMAPPATVPATHDIQQPQETVAQHPATTDPNSTPPSPQQIPDLPASKKAVGYDSATGRASNVSDWSKQAIQYYGKQEGLPQTEIDKLTHNWSDVDRVNHGLYSDNESVRLDPHHYLNKTTYHTTGQNNAAHDLVLQRKHELGIADTPVTPPPHDTGAQPPPDTSSPPPSEAAAPPVNFTGGGTPPPSAPPSLASGAETQAHGVQGHIQEFAYSVHRRHLDYIAMEAGGVGIFTAAGVLGLRHRKRRRKGEKLLSEQKAGTDIPTHNRRRLARNERYFDAARVPRNERNVRSPGRYRSRPYITPSRT